MSAFPVRVRCLLPGESPDRTVLRRSDTPQSTAAGVEEGPKIEEVGSSLSDVGVVHLLRSSSAGNPLITVVSVANDTR